MNHMPPMGFLNNHRYRDIIYISLINKGSFTFHQLPSSCRPAAFIVNGPASSAFSPAEMKTDAHPPCTAIWYDNFKYVGRSDWAEMEPAEPAASSVCWANLPGRLRGVSSMLNGNHALRISGSNEMIFWVQQPLLTCGFYFKAKP